MEYIYKPKLCVSAYVVSVDGHPVAGRSKAAQIVDWLTERMGEHGERWLYKTSFQRRVCIGVVSFEYSTDKLLFDLAWSDQLGTIYSSLEQAYKDTVNEHSI